MFHTTVLGLTGAGADIRKLHETMRRSDITVIPKPRSLFDTKDARSTLQRLLTSNTASKEHCRCCCKLRCTNPAQVCCCPSHSCSSSVILFNSSIVVVGSSSGVTSLQWQGTYRYESRPSDTLPGSTTRATARQRGSHGTSTSPAPCAHWQQQRTRRSALHPACS